MASFKKRLKAFEARVARDGLILTESQVQALDKKTLVDEVCGEIETVIVTKQKVCSLQSSELLIILSLHSLRVLSAEKVTATAMMLLASYRQARKTITVDKGKEFAWRDQITDLSGPLVCFTLPLPLVEKRAR